MYWAAEPTQLANVAWPRVWVPLFVAVTVTGVGCTDPHGAPSTAAVMTRDCVTPIMPFAATPVRLTESAAAGGADATTSRPAPTAPTAPTAVRRRATRPRECEDKGSSRRS